MYARAVWYYRRRQFPLYQIVWPNNNGHYPSSPDATRAFSEWQPVLGADLLCAHLGSATDQN
jgi:Domain of unknown function (DUF4262)